MTLIFNTKNIYSVIKFLIYEHICCIFFNLQVHAELSLELFIYIMSNINFDEFQRDIEAAESYLKGTNVLRSTESKKVSLTDESAIAATSGAEFGDTLFFASDFADNTQETDATKSASPHDQISSLLTFSTVNPADASSSSSSSVNANTNADINVNISSSDFDKTIPRFNYGTGSAMKTTSDSNANTIVPVNDNNSINAGGFSLTIEDGSERVLRPKPVLSSSLNKTIRRGRDVDRLSEKHSNRSLSTGSAGRGSVGRGSSRQNASRSPGATPGQRSRSADRRPKQSQPVRVSDIVKDSTSRATGKSLSNTPTVQPLRSKSPAARPHTQALDNLLRSQASQFHREGGGRGGGGVESTDISRFKYLKSKEDLKREAEDAFNSVCVFTPKLATARDDSSQKEQQGQTQKERVAEMQLNHKKTLQERVKQKQVNESLDVLSSCTFTPQISRGSEKIMRRLQEDTVSGDGGVDSVGHAQGQAEVRGRSTSVDKTFTHYRSRSASPGAVGGRNTSSGGSVRSHSVTRERKTSGGIAASTRLYQDAAHRYEHLQFLRGKVDSIELNECSFQPAINESTNKILFTKNNYEYRPIHERLGDLHRGKQNVISAIRQSVEERERDLCTFVPVISGKSHRMATMRNGQVGSNGGATGGTGTGAGAAGVASVASVAGAGSRYEHEYPYDFRNDDEPETESVDDGACGLGMGVSSSSAKQTSIPAYDRLLSQGLGYKHHKTQLVIQKAVDDNVKFNQFRPKICKGTESLIQRNDTLAKASFNQRQAMDMVKRKQHSAERSKFFNNTEEPQEGCGTDLWRQKGFSFAPPSPNATSNAGAASTSTGAGTGTGTGTGSAAWFKPNTALSSKRSTALLEEAAAVGNMSVGHGINESLEAKVDRMSRQQVQMYESHRKELTAKVYSRETYTYKPKIDAISKQLGRQSSLKELVENRKGKATKEACIRQVNEALGKDCPFKPKINTTSSASKHSQLQSKPHNMGTGAADDCLLGDEVARMYNRPTVESFARAGGSINMQEPERMARDIRMHIREKEELRRQQLAVREIEELKHCTFQPDTSATSRSYYKYSHAPQPPGGVGFGQQSMENDHRYTSPTSHVARQQQQQWVDDSGASINASIIPKMVPIRGLNRHLELKKKAEQLKIEQIEREREVFSVGNISSYRREEDSSTIVQVCVIGMFVYVYARMCGWHVCLYLLIFHF